MTSIRVIPVSAVLSRVPYECLYLQKWVTPPLSGAAPHPGCRCTAAMVLRYHVNYYVGVCSFQVSEFLEPLPMY